MKQKRFHIIQHVPFEKAEEIEDWAKNQGHSISYTHIYKGQKLPELNAFDVLVIMGGPMSVYEEERYPWIKEEDTFIKDSIDQGKSIIGICLGAQYLAKALGARVYKGPEKEIGWFPVNFHTSFYGVFPDSQTVFHWHGDTFDIPSKAIPLASSQAVPNQGFIYNEKVIALQFHLEVKKPSVSRMLVECSDDLAPGAFVQESSVIEKEDRYYDGNRKIINNLLSQLCDMND